MAKPVTGTRKRDFFELNQTKAFIFSLIFIFVIYILVYINYPNLPFSVLFANAVLFLFVVLVCYAVACFLCKLFSRAK